MRLKESFMRDALNKIAVSEGVTADTLREKIKKGVVVVPLNKARRDIDAPCGIGEGLKVKVNANIGGAPGLVRTGDELRKLKVSVEYGADTVMDLTAGKKWQEILRGVLENSPVPVGTVPVYGAFCDAGQVEDLTDRNFIDTLRIQAEMGVDFMTVHSGVCREVIAEYESSGRIGGIVSRGGKIIYRWMKKTGLENPLYEKFDEILEIASEYGVTLSLGDGLRPGCLADASDAPQYAELRILGKLAERCREKGVQVMIEGPGHVPLNLIEENVRIQKEVCKGAPFYVLGPLTTDIGAGYDHITGAIGGAVAAWKGADFLCYLTPAEHLRLPDEKDVALGVIASRIAAHSADIARNPSKLRAQDDLMSRARRNLDWEQMLRHALDPRAVSESMKKRPVREDKACTMCGEYCALLD